MAENLVIAYNAPPFNDGSATTVAKRILDQEKTVDLLSADLSAIRDIDESLFEVISHYVDRQFLIKVVPKWADYENVTNFVEDGLKIIESRHLFYEEMYSRSMWIHSHFLAATLKVRGVSKQWTAEFSDPLLLGVRGERRKSGHISIDRFSMELLNALDSNSRTFLTAHTGVMEWAQYLPFIIADELIFTNEQQLKVMLRGLPEFLVKRVRTRATISSHPTLPRNFYERGEANSHASKNDGHIRHIGYFGTFYPNRGGGEFLQALALLPQEIQQSIRVDIYANGCEDLARAGNFLDVSKMICIKPPLRYLDFLSTADRYDALLVNDISTRPFGVSSPFLPSKYSDYKGSQTPIMAITIPGSPLDQMEIAWKAHVGDLDGIINMLSQFAMKNHSRLECASTDQN